MTDVAGLVLGVAALWKTCVAVFESIDSGRNYGMDYELLRVKLEVERIRLHSWGDAVGLRDDGDNLHPDPRLERDNVANTAMRVLGCIHHLFENSERLQNTYGLKSSTVDAQNMLTASQGQPILGSVFKKAYEGLRNNARDRQKETKISRKTIWVIKDKQKFQAMISEIKGFNDNLESLFLGSSARIAEVMREDVENSANTEELQLLQDATAEDHGDISDYASARLEVLGVASTVRSDLLTVQENDPEQDGKPEDLESQGDANDGQTAHAESLGMSDIEKKIYATELYYSKKREGALCLGVSGPFDHSAKVTAHCYWGGKTENHWGVDRPKGLVKTVHASFALYKLERFRPRDKDEFDDTEEASVLLDVEAHSEYENINPGTVTVEGFGLDAWDFEETYHSRNDIVFMSTFRHDVITAKKLLRRIHELQNSPGRFGWNPHKDLADLREFTGDMGHQWANPSYEFKEMHQLRDLYNMLNRTDIFIDFLTISSVGLEWTDPKRNGNGLWDILWQIIIANEVIRRYKYGSMEGWTAGFSARVLASMIIADRWLKSIDLVIVEAGVQTSGFGRPDTAELKAEAEEFKKKGNEALSKKDYTKVMDFYTQAVKIDPWDAVYHSNRSAAFYAVERYRDAVADAYIATEMDPKYAKAWSRYGLALIKMGLGKRAIEAYETAITVAGNDATDAMKRGLADAKAKNEADLKAIRDEKDEKKREILRKEYREQDFDILMKTVELHSNIHEQQVEGLLYFAEQFKWPWINEVRDYCEESYSNMRGGPEPPPVGLQDWLFGLTLPGRWFSFKIMSSLVLSTVSIRESLAVAWNQDCGLVLPKKSYWRVRTVLGRVLGCTPSVISLCGWIGPCPPVEFIPPLLENKPCYVYLKARQVSLVEHNGFQNGNTIYISGPRDLPPELGIRSDEEVEQWISNIQDASNWVIPEPPVKQVSTCEMKAIQLKRDMSAKEKSGDGRADYRAQIVFKMDDSNDLITYKLFTNPVFVTLPPCYAGPRGAHQVHLRELSRYDEKNIWTIERLKEHTAEDTEDTEVMTINATGKGAELLARAWCSERGKNAVIRRSGGPCFVCAERAASNAGLKTGVLIWVS